MEEETKQILMNQATIMRCLCDLRAVGTENLIYIKNRMEETSLILQPKETKRLQDRTREVLKDDSPQTKTPVANNQGLGGVHLIGLEQSDKTGDFVNTKETEVKENV